MGWNENTAFSDFLPKTSYEAYAVLTILEERPVLEKLNDSI